MPLNCPSPSRIAVGTKGGTRTYSTSPFQLLREQNGDDASIIAMHYNTDLVRQLRPYFEPFQPYFGPFLTVSLSSHPTRAVWYSLIGAQAYRMLIGACNPILYPMHVS